METEAYDAPSPTVRRNDLQLRDIRGNELVVSHVHVREGETFTEVHDTSARLPMECLTLFDGEGAVAADALTGEEREWVAAESAARSNAIEFVREGWV